MPGIRNRGRLVALTLFGLPFLLAGLGGAAIGVHLVLWKGQIGVGLVATAIALCIGLMGYVLVVHQWVDAARSHQTTRYALSTRAAYVWKDGAKPMLSVYPILPGTPIELERCAGHDSLWFHVRREDDNDGGTKTTRIGFEGVDDGAKVYRLMRSIQSCETST